MDNIRVENIRGYMNTPQGGEGIWQANETVEVGDMRTLSGRDNTGYMLEYVGAGVTGDTQPTVPSLTEVANYSAIDRVGKMRMIFNLAEKDVDEILAAGVLYNRATYEELWNYVQLKPSLLISEAEWQAKYAQTNGKFVPFYSEGDGTTTFRTPLLSAYPCGVSSSDDIGNYASDGLQNITALASGGVGTYTEAGYPIRVDGAFQGVNMDTNKLGVAGGNQHNFYDLGLDASLSNPIYGNADEVRPKTMYGIWVIKAIGVIVDSIGNTDIQNLLTGLNQLQTQITTLQNQIADSNNFAIVYPNGGTKESPANITALSHYVENNPFDGYYIYLEPQVQFNNNWIKSVWNSNWGSGAECQGVTASQINNEIHIVTGKTILYEDIAGPITTGQWIPNTDGIRYTELPCRVLVYKLGKIESEE